ncbi:thioredoxin family protein [Candidatus Micrarchaeota archaeon]|nr:thioredoxin family protein [Candidatus Micrarchaeota archaeon]
MKFVVGLIIIMFLVFGCVNPQTNESEPTVWEGNTGATPDDQIQNQQLEIQNIESETQNSQPETGTTEPETQNMTLENETQNSLPEPETHDTGLETQNQSRDIPVNGTNETELQTITFPITNENGSLVVYYFYMSSCSACKSLAPDVDRIESEYPEAAFKRYEIRTQGTKEIYVAYAEQYNLSTSQRYVPQALVNNTILTGIFEINETLGGIIENYTNARVS